MARISNAERARHFGEPGKVRTVKVLTPWGVTAVVHELLRDQFIVACERAKRKSDWVPKRIDSYNPRPIRGTKDTWSIHAWALAFDFFATRPTEPPPGGVWKPDNTVPPEFAAAFEELGFTWGAKFRSRADYPHIEWASAPPAKGQSQGQGSTTDSRTKAGKRVFLYEVQNGADKGKTFISDGIHTRYVDDGAELAFLERQFGATKRDVPTQVHDSLKLVKAA